MVFTGFLLMYLLFQGGNPVKQCGIYACILLAEGGPNRAGSHK